jgi:hypothetical protein
VFPRDEFDDYVEHPRFGRRPRITDLKPLSKSTGVYTYHWRSNPTTRVPNTAVAAEMYKQKHPSVPVAYYSDEKRRCRDCGRPFLFFADEQKFWYEILRLPLEVDCVRCTDCRRSIRDLKRLQHRYEEQVHNQNLSFEETLELIHILLTLIESALFTPNQLPHVRELMNRIPKKKWTGLRMQSYRNRLDKLEADAAGT